MTDRIIDDIELPDIHGDVSLSLMLQLIGVAALSTLFYAFGAYLVRENVFMLVLASVFYLVPFVFLRDIVMFRYKWIKEKLEDVQRRTERMNERHKGRNAKDLLEFLKGLSPVEKRVVAEGVIASISQKRIATVAVSMLGLLFSGCGWGLYLIFATHLHLSAPF